MRKLMTDTDCEMEFLAYDLRLIELVTHLRDAGYAAK